MDAAVSYMHGSLTPDEFHAPRELEYPLLSIKDVPVDTLVWIQPHWMRPAYELWAGERVVATLRFKGLHCSQALAASAEGLWTFERSGMEDTVAVHQFGGQVATLEERDAISSVLGCVNGATYVWVREGLFGQRWAFADITGKPLLFFAPESSPQARIRIQIATGAPRGPQLTFLAALGKYLMLARRNVKWA